MPSVSLSVRTSPLLLFSSGPLRFPFPSGPGPGRKEKRSEERSDTTSVERQGTIVKV